MIFLEGLNLMYKSPWKGHPYLFLKYGLNLTLPANSCELKFQIFFVEDHSLNLPHYLLGKFPLQKTHSLS